MNNKFVRAVLIVGLFVVAPACGLRPPVQNSGAATSPEGVSFAVLAQRCTETVETDLPDVPLIEIRLQIEVRNATPPALVIQGGAFELRGPDGRSIPTTSWKETDPLSIAAGQTRTVELRFMTRGGLSCTKPMQLEAPTRVTKGDAPVRLGPVTFVPSRA